MSLSRRTLLSTALATAGAGVLVPSVKAQTSARDLSFYHIHTGEKISLTYFADGQYQPDALAALNHFLRDWRTGDVHDIDPRVFDQLVALQAKVDTGGAFNVICGYRSPATNAMLHERSERVATHSLHMEGPAMDLCLPGKDLSQLHEAALSLKAGGVGYYPASNFIHMDTGPVRRWG